MAAAAADLSGGSFAFVMATGIVSIAAELQSFHRLALALFALNAIAYLVLAGLTLLRLALHPAAALGELSRHETGAGFLTFVAATGIVGNQIALLTSQLQIAAGLWLLACISWAALVYAFLFGLTIRPDKPPLATGLDGAWLLLVVSSEALTVLGTHVAVVFARPHIVIFTSICWFLVGIFFYFVIESLILYRLLFEPLRPVQFTPPYWISMGAVAIATLAGARLESVAGLYPLLAWLIPAISAATILSWAVATWWVPLLLALMCWRHAMGGVRLSYHLEYWSMVFPLGMYSAATWNFARDLDLSFLNVMSRIFLWIAFAAWLTTSVGMIRRALAKVVKA